jgi:chemotaxis protein methyltransferase CheR
MTDSISDQLLARCGEVITARFGLHFPKKRHRDLERGIVRAALDLGFSDPDVFIPLLVDEQLTKEQSDALVSHLTIGETYFFREKNSFEALRMHILPALLDSRQGVEKRLRIWCAGCSTGEEPYSVAILLHRMIADLARWNITILATDINPASLRKGIRGEYSDWSFRDTPRWLKERYFTASGPGKYAISEAIRKMVTFAPFNLAQDPYPALSSNTNAMDIIFCRNVLMYFAPEQATGAIERFRHSLLDGGWLIVSPCETSHVLFADFAAETLNNTILYRKDEQRQRAASPPYEAAGGVKCLSAVPDSRMVKSPPAPLLQRGEIHPPVAPETIQVAPPVSPYAEALLFYNRGEYDEATEILAAYLTDSPAGPDFGEAAALLAQTLANRGNFPLALEWSEKAVAVDKLNPLPYYLQATIFLEQGVDDAAAVSLRTAIYLDHGFVLAHFALASLAMRRGERKEAARHLENAASLLHAFGDDDILPGSDGMSARRLAEIISATRGSIEAGKG